MLTEGELFLGKYRIESLVGSGGMGAVYAALDVTLARKVAIKVLLPEVARSQLAATRFVNEGRAAARVESEHVARVFSAGRTEEGLPYMVLELLEGVDLAQLLHERGKLGIGEAVDLLVQALDGVGEAHRHGIVHRDLKPANLFLHRRSKAAPIVKVLDFGVSKASRPLTETSEHQNLTATSTLIGSPHYMAPEQLLDSKSADHRADIWSLGCILYEMLTGDVPFDDPVLSGLVISILRKTPRPVRQLRPDVPAPLESILMRCLERDPAQRIADVPALARLLVPFATHPRAPVFAVPSVVSVDAEAPPPSVAAKTRVWVPKRPTSEPPPEAPARQTPLPERTTPMPALHEHAPQVHAPLPAPPAPPAPTPSTPPAPMPSEERRARPLHSELPSLLVIAATLVFLGISGFLFAQRHEAHQEIRSGGANHAPAASHPATARPIP